MFVGMLTGLATMLYVWSATPIAWTWHALIGAVVTILAAKLTHAARPTTPLSAST